MVGLRLVRWLPVLGVTALALTFGACSGSDSPATSNTPVGTNTTVDSGCQKFCRDQAGLASTCVDAKGQSNALPEQLCDSLCMDPTCYTPPGLNSGDLKLFFDCAKSAPSSECDTVDGIAQPLGCADQLGFVEWIEGWGYVHKPSVCAAR